MLYCCLSRTVIAFGCTWNEQKNLFYGHEGSIPLDREICILFTILNGEEASFSFPCPYTAISLTCKIAFASVYHLIWLFHRLLFCNLRHCNVIKRFHYQYCQLSIERSLCSFYIIFLCMLWVRSCAAQLRFMLFFDRSKIKWNMTVINLTVLFPCVRNE